MKSRLLIFSVVLLVVLNACGPAATPAPTVAPTKPAPTAAPTSTPVPPSPTQPPVNEFAVMAEAADKYLASGKPVLMAVDKLYEVLNDGDDKNDPFVLDVRKPEDYAKGHIKNAVNIPLANVFKPENLAKLPKDKQIVVYCYTGHTCSMASMTLDAMGYNAVALSFSMMAWSQNDELLGGGKRFPAEQKDYPVDTQPVELPAAGKTPSVSTGKTAVADMIAAQADKYLASGKATLITADKVYEVLNDGDDKNDPFILDIRKPEDYAKGHIKGAVNVVFANVFKAENLARYPTDKQIVVYCYTGHTCSMTSFYMNVLGYNAISLKWGIMGWSKNDDLMGGNKRFPAQQKDYPVVK